MFGLFKHRRRQKLLARGFPEAWRAILEKTTPYVNVLDADERRELEGLVQVFIAEKHFEGCNSLVITDEMRVTIAVQACLLLLHRNTDIYPRLDTILVYPHAYLVNGEHRNGPVVVECTEVRLGESWTRGMVVLAWDHAKAVTHPMGSVQNIVLHEFAHQLDAEDGAMNGAPNLQSRASYAAWARVLGEEYAELSARLRAGIASDIDPYGATSPSEFFAVVTEMFFERPQQMRDLRPKLYAELAAFYRQDPAAAIDRAQA